MTTENKTLNTDDLTATELAKEYEYYFEQCEKANKKPLDFRAWLKQNYNTELSE